MYIVIDQPREVLQGGKKNNKNKKESKRTRRYGSWGIPVMH